MFNTEGVNTITTEHKRSPKRARAQRTLRMNLDVTRDEDSLVDSICKMWKQKQSMSTYIRKAILIFWDLQQGRVDLLLQEFPHVEKVLRARIIERELAAYEQRLKEIQARATVPPPVLLEVIHRQSQEIAALTQWATDVGRILDEQKQLPPGG